MTASRRLAILQWLTVLVPAVCAGLYETVRHSLLASELPNALGTALAVALVLAISSVFARVAFGIIRQTQASLEERSRRLEDLSRKVERLATMEERDRLAREMHDGIAQVLASLLMRLDTVESLLERGRTADATAEVRRLRESGQDAYNEVREAIAGLRLRPDAGAAGLAAALREYVAQFGERTGITARCEVGPLDAAADDVLPAAELQLLRVAQEALTNVRKHAGARHVEVRFGRDPDGWRLTVRDDGSGFDPEAAPNGTTRHFGLIMMRERAEAVGGELRISSHPGEGALVSCFVPAAPVGPRRYATAQGHGTARDALTDTVAKRREGVAARA